MSKWGDVSFFGGMLSGLSTDPTLTSKKDKKVNPTGRPGTLEEHPFAQLRISRNFCGDVFFLRSPRFLGSLRCSMEVRSSGWDAGRC